MLRFLLIHPLVCELRNFMDRLPLPFITPDCSAGDTHMRHCVTGPVIHKQIKILLNNPKLFLICKQDCDKFITADTVDFSIISKLSSSACTRRATLSAACPSRSLTAFRPFTPRTDTGISYLLSVSLYPAHRHAGYSILSARL